MLSLLSLPFTPLAMKHCCFNKQYKNAGPLSDMYWVLCTCLVHLHAYLVQYVFLTFTVPHKYRVYNQASCLPELC